MQPILNKTPVYQQLNQLLRELLRQGDFAPGTQFLTERQVCERFGVSRATANKALSNLVAEGLLEFRKGVGTFVRGGLLHYDTDKLVSFTERALAAGTTPTTQMLEFKRVGVDAVTPEVAQELRPGAGQELWYVERLRLASGIPVILERRHIVARLCPGLQSGDLEGSLYALWAQRYGLEVAGADELIRAVALRGEEARLLAVRSGSPGFQVSATGYLADGTPLWREETWYRGDMYEFRNHMGPIQSGRAASGALRTK